MLVASKRVPPKFAASRLPYQEGYVCNCIRCLLSSGSTLCTEGPECDLILLLYTVLTDVNEHCTESQTRTGPRGIKLLHYNASNHKTKQIAAYIKDIGMKILLSSIHPLSESL